MSLHAFVNNSTDISPAIHKEAGASWIVLANLGHDAKLNRSRIELYRGQGLMPYIVTANIEETVLVHSISRGVGLQHLNEPDQSNQNERTPEQYIGELKTLARHGIKCSGPGVCSRTWSLTWLKHFYKLDGLKLLKEFAGHLYPKDPEGFKGEVDSYRREIGNLSFRVSEVGPVGDLNVLERAIWMARGIRTLNALRVPAAFYRMPSPDGTGLIDQDAHGQWVVKNAGFGALKAALASPI
jgi:hypothetical protein